MLGTQGRVLLIKILSTPFICNWITIYHQLHKCNLVALSPKLNFQVALPDFTFETRTDTDMSHKWQGPQYQSILPHATYNDDHDYLLMIMTKFQLKTRSMIIGASKPTFEVVMLEGWTPRSFLMGVWVPGYQQTQENYRKLWGTNQFLCWSGTS